VKILVIRRDNIGDLVCTTPLITALRAHFPRARLAALTNSYNVGVLDGNPDLDAVYSYTKLKHRGPGESWFAMVRARLRLTATLRRERFDYAILAKAGFDRHGLELARAIGVRDIVGFAPVDAKTPTRITMPVAFPKDETLHEVETVMRLGAALGIDVSPGKLRVIPCAARMQAWRERLPVAERGRLWVALHISARETTRRWSAACFTQLIDRLVAQHDLGVVLLWSPGTADNPMHPGDDDKADAILRAVNHRDKVIPAPTTELQDLSAVLSLCDVFIGVDGGAMHMAAGIGMPMVALFENIPFKQQHWYPWQVPYEMVVPVTRDIADVTVEQVLAAWQRLCQRCLLHSVRGNSDTAVSSRDRA
jgi:ADP-heptose:LPS heptosyltransferase